MIPVTLIGGYLGAGKSTLLNQLIRQADGLRLALLVNDFGQVNIDADLIESRSETLINLAGGCVCCSFGSDLVSTLSQLTQAEQPPEHLLIETSGVALPASLVQSLSLVSGLRHDLTLIMVDARTLPGLLRDKYMADTVHAQLACADLLVLNKVDLVTATELDNARRLARAAAGPDALLIESDHANVDRALVLGSAARLAPSFPLTHRVPAQTRPATASPFRLGHARRMPFRSVTLTCSHPLDLNALDQGLQSGTTGVFRAKGLLRDAQNQWMLFQWVAGRADISPWLRPLPPSAGYLICIGADTQLNESALRGMISGVHPQGVGPQGAAVIN